jgi:hypothetical protein
MDYWKWEKYNLVLDDIFDRHWKWPSANLVVRINCFFNVKIVIFLLETKHFFPPVGFRRKPQVRDPFSSLRSVVLFVDWKLESVEYARLFTRERARVRSEEVTRSSARAKELPRARKKPNEKKLVFVFLKDEKEKKTLVGFI